MAVAFLDEPFGRAFPAFFERTALRVGKDCRVARALKSEK
jgi:hypothetical protein